MSGGRERRKHYRAKIAALRHVTIAWRPIASTDTPEPSHWQRGRARDLGTGGAFIVLGDPAAAPAIGQPLELQLHLPGTALPLALTATVRRVVDAAHDPLGDAGLGVQFNTVEFDVLLELNDLLARAPGA